MSDQTERIRELEAEVAGMTGMRNAARRRAENAEARVRELEAAAQQLRDAHQGEVEKVARVEALAEEEAARPFVGYQTVSLRSLRAALRGESC